MQHIKINNFRGLDVVTDSPDAAANSLAVAENIFVRPAGALRRSPAFSKLWNMYNLRLYVENDLNFGQGDGVILLKIESPAGHANRMTVLVAYDCDSFTTQGCFFVGRPDGSVPTTDDLAGINFPASVPGPTAQGPDPVLNRQYNVSISAIGDSWTAGKRLYFSRIYNEIWIGNGVDPNAIYTPATGGIRKAGTNEFPEKPLVGSVSSLPAAAATQAGLSYIVAGTTTTVVGTSSITTGTATLRITADPINFKGVAGHNIRVRIVQAVHASPITSTRTGAGTALSPFIYTLNIGNSANDSSGNALANFINSDSKTTGVITASVETDAPGANPGLWSGVTQTLTGGADETLPGGHPSGRRFRFATTLYAPSTHAEFFDYEGPASELSEEVVGNGSNDFLVTVRAKTNVDNRFTKIGIWMREYLGPSYPINPKGPFSWRKLLLVNNENATYRITKNFTTLEESVSPPAQGRMPPCTMFEFAGNKVWGSGNADEFSRIWISKVSTELETVPEGCDIKSYLDIEGKKEEPQRPRVTALRKLENRVQVHTDRSITLVEASSLNRIVSRSDYGAINPSCLASWNRPDIVYLGSDGVFYTMVNTQYYRSQPATPKAWPAMRSAVDIAAITANPQRCNLLADSTSNIVMAWLPMKNGEYSAFAYDVASQELTGPIQWPKLYSCSSVSTADSRFVGCDETGDLFVFDLGYLHNQVFTQSNSYIPLDIRQPPAPDYQSRASGLPIYFFDDGTWVPRGFKCVFETQWLDLGEPHKRKGFFTLEWTTARFTRAITTVTLTSDYGHTKVFECGDLYTERQKIAFAISGNAIKVRFDAVVGDDKGYLVRDLTIGYELQENAGFFF